MTGDLDGRGDRWGRWCWCRVLELAGLPGVDVRLAEDSALLVLARVLVVVLCTLLECGLL